MDLSGVRMVPPVLKHRHLRLPQVWHRQPAAGSGTELFANCTELRKKYPNGVPKGHPAYQDKMDRDKDGYACEK